MQTNTVQVLIVVRTNSREGRNISAPYKRRRGVSSSLECYAYRPSPRPKVASSRHSDKKKKPRSNRTMAPSAISGFRHRGCRRRGVTKLDRNEKLPYMCTSIRNHEHSDGFLQTMIEWYQVPDVSYFCHLMHFRSSRGPRTSFRITMLSCQKCTL